MEIEKRKMIMDESNIEKRLREEHFKNERFMTLPEIRAAAKEVIQPKVWGFAEGAAESETTLRRNRRALRRLAIRQRVLVDVRKIDVTTDFLGMKLPIPAAVSPMGSLALFHPEGDLEMARGAGLGGNLNVVSGVTGWRVEDVARAATGPLFFQLYHFGERPWVEDLMNRVQTSGYKAVCLTVDVAVYGRRERDMLVRFDPRFFSNATPNPPPNNTEIPARLTWKDVEWLKSILKIPFGLKGIMTAEDAKRAVEAGVEIIWISNHGGRQLDHGQATVEVLPEIVEAVAGRAKIMIDGGFSRGTDIVKAVALGANVVGLGRTSLWGLAADGAAGVDRTFQLLQEEMKTTMALCGRTSLRDLTPDLICRADR